MEDGRIRLEGNPALRVKVFVWRICAVSIVFCANIRFLRQSKINHVSLYL